jgi:bile acid transporter
MLGLGSTVRINRFREHFKKPKGIIIGLLCQFVLMPPLAYSLSSALKLRAIHRVGLVLLGCCPGGAMSNIVCFLARADLDLSVAMTTSSSLGALAMMPLNVYIYIRLTGLADHIKLDYRGIAISAVLVIAGILGGVAVKQWTNSQAQKHTAGSRQHAQLLKVTGVLGAVGAVGTFVTGLITNSKSETPVWASDTQMYIAALLQALLGIALGFGAARVAGLPRPSCVAVSIETSVQNAVLAMAIIAITFDGEEEGQAMVVPMAYVVCTTW